MPDNMPTPETDHTYNGWTNWDTWDVWVWLTNDYEAYKELVTKVKDFSLFRLREFTVHIIPGREGVDYNMVNWQEVRDALLEED